MKVQITQTFTKVFEVPDTTEVSYSRLAELMDHTDEEGEDGWHHLLYSYDEVDWDYEVLPEEGGGGEE